jgi:hypothetical protein
LKNLPDVTLLAVSSDRVQSNIDALVRCRELMNFGDVKFISHVKPDNLPDGISFGECSEIKSIYDYDCFSFLEMGWHVETPFALLIQDHAQIIHPEIWDDNWLQYDWISAPWPERPEFISISTGQMIRVGNGGFRLTSQKMMRLPKTLGLTVVFDRGWSADDGLFCSYYAKIFLENGIKYAPVEEAAKFSYENDVPENMDIIKFFGYHKYHCDRME